MARAQKGGIRHDWYVRFADFSQWHLPQEKTIKGMLYESPQGLQNSENLLCKFSDRRFSLAVYLYEFDEALFGSSNGC